MGASERRNKSSAMASYMALHPNDFPDSIMRNGNAGNGADTRRLARQMGHVPNEGSHFSRGMYGGLMVARITGNLNGIPDAFQHEHVFPAWERESDRAMYGKE